MKLRLMPFANSSPNTISGTMEVSRMTTVVRQFRVQRKRVYGGERTRGVGDYVLGTDQRDAAAYRTAR